MDSEQSWKTSLHMSNYIGALEPGEYTVRIQYHNTHTIADEAAIDGWLVYTSPPFKLMIKPAVVSFSAEEATCVKEWLRAIPADATMKVLAGTYSKAHYAFIAPDSPQGKILGKGTLPPCRRSSTNSSQKTRL